MYGMFAHRLMTLGHIVSSRHIRKFGKKKTFNMNKVIEQSGVSIMKDMIQNVEVNTKTIVIKRDNTTQYSKHFLFYILNRQLPSHNLIISFQVESILDSRISIYFLSF